MSATQELTRGSSTGTTRASIRRRALNWRYLIRLTIVTAIFIGAAYAMHRRQVSRQTQTLLRLGTEAQAKGELKKAVDYYSRYMVLAPGDTEVHRFGMIARVARLPGRQVPGIPRS